MTDHRTEADEWLEFPTDAEAATVRDLVDDLAAPGLAADRAWRVIYTLAPLIRAREAAAWDEGHEAGWWACHDEDDEPRNPYRQEADQGGRVTQDAGVSKGGCECRYVGGMEEIAACGQCLGRSQS